VPNRTADRELLLGVYLNDHLAGATLGVDLAKRVARAERDWAGGETLAGLVLEIEQDRATLVELMSALRIPVRRYKTVAAWAAEKLSRLKFNGRLLHRSPLSRVVELEVLRLGVTGKAAAWRTLRTVADREARLDVTRLDELLNRARRQTQQQERLRARAAAEAFGDAASTPLSS
jgi:predicted DNA-binding ribbon-helix-helix protein